jgi:predicted PurR-regulated permease PerM
MTFKNYADILKLALLVVAVAIIPVLVWYLFGVILMAFGAIILAMLLHLGSQPFMRWLRLPQTAALTLSGLVILIILGGAGYMFGTRIIDEFQDVVQRATSAGGVIRSDLQESEFGNFLLHHVSSGDFSLAGVLPGFLRLSTSFL